MRRLLLAVTLATCATACEQAAPSTANAQIQHVQTEVVDPAKLPPLPAPAQRKPLPTDPPAVAWSPPDPTVEPIPAEPGAPGDPGAAPGKRDGYELLGAGAEPRFELRYRAPQGTTQKLGMSTKMSMTVPPEPALLFPEVIVSATVEATKVSADGVMTLEISLTGADVKDVAGSKIPAEQVKAQMGDVVGMKTSILVDPLGHMTDLQGAIIQQVEQTQMGFNQLAAVLPKEPVGKGAKWKIRQKVGQGGLTLDQVLTFEVLAVTETTAKLRQTGRLSAPSQSIDWQGQPVELEKTTGTANADMTIDFTRLVPEVRGTVEMTMKMNAGGEKATMTTKSVMKMHARK